ncbi:hypothetical protein F4775DRAFT_587524 [Biscogniauxia sp. FL1348]|nr:hypothetical protein F4775DRAFT_587524 [Biscogniauxia sp. FL1348]
MSEALPPLTRKRIIVCCDGTWQNADNGYIKPTSSDPVPKLQIPSNVTRISRCFKRRCSEGTFQIVYYQSGVGSRAGIIDRILGGAFGLGISENIREAYAYICANYVDGDEIVLVGFSRGAFTARSIGGMISDLGLLTREGMEYFYPVFKDMQNWMNPDYEDPFPNLPFSDKPKGTNAMDAYRQKLVENGYTRVRQGKGQGDFIKVKAIGVWDTLSHKIEHAFHALALDETRGPFSPTLWERAEQCETLDLRQVWFPGSHANVGGGWEDQGIANTTLAWMMDQLSSVGVEFLSDALDRLFEENMKYYQNKKPSNSTLEKCTSICCGCHGAKGKLLWATKPIFESNEPVRPWSLHAIRSVQSPIYDIAGSVTRSPGMYKKINPKNGRRSKEFLKETNERIHSSVRVRLACEGLGINDSDTWFCPSLLKYWHPRRVTDTFDDPVSKAATWGPQPAGISPKVMDNPGMTDSQLRPINKANIGTAKSSTWPNNTQVPGSEPSDGLRWVWEYVGPENGAPIVKTIVEENMGPFEKHLLQLAAGKVQVFEYAENQDPTNFRALQHKVLKKLKRSEKQQKKETKQKHEHKKHGHQHRETDRDGREQLLNQA